MSDLWTMMWKEWKDLLGSGGPSDWFRPLLIVGVMGIVLPLSAGRTWLDLGPAPFLIMVYIPFLLLATFIGDAVAGERERHTLETLLASRISDRAILLSKVLIAVAYNWALTVLSLVLGALIANLSQGSRPWQFYPPLNFLIVLVLCFLLTLLAASGGVLISLKSSTVRQASQTMLLALIILSLSIAFIVQLLPSEWLTSLTMLQGVLITLLGLAVLDTILLAVSLAQFRRSRLIVG